MTLVIVSDPVYFAISRIPKPNSDGNRCPYSKLTLMK